MSTTMSTTTATRPAPPGLGSLEQVELSEGAGKMLEIALQHNYGPGLWRDRKRIEARKLLGLAALAEPQRMEVLTLDLHSELRTVVRLRTPVALTPGPDDRLRLADEAVLGILYPSLVLTVPLPGFSMVTLLQPAHDAFYPNVGTAPGQRMCLGLQIPVGLPLTEVVILSHGLLTLQNVMLDPDDRAGVMNGEAAAWYQAHPDAIPLTGEPFLGGRARTGHGSGDGGSDDACADA